MRVQRSRRSSIGPLPRSAAGNFAAAASQSATDPHQLVAASRSSVLATSMAIISAADLNCASHRLKSASSAASLGGVGAAAVVFAPLASGVPAWSGALASPQAASAATVRAANAASRTQPKVCARRALRSRCRRSLGGISGQPARTVLGQRVVCPLTFANLTMAGDEGEAETGGSMLSCTRAGAGGMAASPARAARTAR